MTVTQRTKQLLYSMGAVRRLSRRRLRVMDDILGGRLLKRQPGGLKILEIGCSQGKDLVTFLDKRADLQIVGLDLRDYGLRQSNFHMVVGDAERLPFPAGYFDVAISVGVLEHILPLEKLASVAREIRRVSRAYIVIVPSLGSVFEPHSARLLWHLRDARKKEPYSGTLIYLSDEAWLGLGAFQSARSRRFSHVPPFVNNLIIYEQCEGTRS